MKFQSSCIIVLCILFFISGCGFENTVDDKNLAEAQALISSLKNKNQTLSTFKGVGKIKLKDKNKSQTARIAWIGSTSGKLRTEVFDISGQPIASTSNNGQYFYFISHLEHRFYKHPTVDPSLKTIISIPVKTSDMTDLLTGRIPIREHHIALMIRDESGAALVLKRGWGICEKIYFDDKMDVQRIEFFDESGTLEYQAKIDRMQDVEQYRIPFQMEFSTHEGISLQLYINQYWPDIVLSSSIFELALSDQPEQKESEFQMPDMGH